MNIELSFFPLYWLYLFIYNNQVQSVQLPRLDSCGIPWSSGQHIALQLLNSWESIQGSSRTTCQLRNNLERPAAKCSSGHSLRTFWCEILLEIPFDPTDLSPRFMKNWSNSLWLRVCGGLVGTRLVLWIVRLHLFENNLTDTFRMRLSILARPHSSFKLLVLGVADPFLWLMLLPQKKWTDQKGQSDMSPKNILKQLKLWIPKPSAEEWNICSQEWNTITIRSAILVWNTLSCWAACKAMCLIEHSSRDVIGFHHSSVQKVCRFLGSRVCEAMSRQYELQSMRARSFNHADIFGKISTYLRKILTHDLYWTAHALFNLISKQFAFSEPENYICLQTSLCQNRSDLPRSSEILFTNVQTTISDPVWKLGKNECMTTVNALSIWSEWSYKYYGEHVWQ